MQRPHAQRGTQASHQPVGAALCLRGLGWRDLSLGDLALRDLALKEGNDVVWMRDPRVDRDQRQIRLACRNPRCQLRQSGCIGVGGWRRKDGGKTTAVAFDLLVRLTDEERAALSKAVGRFAAFLGRPLEVSGLD